MPTVARCTALSLLTTLMLACASPPRAASAPPATTSAPPPSSPPAPSTPPPPSTTDYAAIVAPLLAPLASPSVHAPGCAVAIYKAGVPVLATGFGYANLEHDVPIEPTTVFEIASMSKQLTATAVVLLAADGKLSLDDDVRKLIPELPTFPRIVTLRHLLHHTGGLREYDTLLDLSGYDRADVATESEALQLVALQRGVNFPAGSRWSYSNTGYFLLSQVVKRASGKTLAVFSKERIFEPLGMTSTRILDDHTVVVPRRATGYANASTDDAHPAFAIAMSNREETGEGNVQSTVVDLAKWDAAFYDARPFGEPWLRAMRTPGKLDDGRPLPYAMGLIVGATSGVATEEHSGAWAGYRSELIRYPAERLAVAVLCNSAEAEPTALAKAIGGALIPALRGQTPNGTTTKESPPAAPLLAVRDLAAMAGAYIDRDALRVRTVVVKDGAASIVHGVDATARGRALDAAPSPVAGKPAFRVRGTPTVLTFEAATAKTAARLLRASETGPSSAYERFAVTPGDARALDAYAGSYRSYEATRDLDLVVEAAAAAAGAKPFLRLGSRGKKLADARFHLVARDVLVADDDFALRFERDAGGKIVALVMYLEGFKALRWERAPKIAPPPLPPH